MDITKSLTRRFWAKVSKARPAECWIWRGAKTTTKSEHQYGLLYVGPIPGRKSKTYKAHRLSYIIAHGHDPGYVMHVCDTTLCVNPSHLKAGSHQENMADMKRKGRARSPKGEASGNALLGESDVIEILRSTDTQAALAKRFSVSKQTISAIKTRVSWRHVSV